MIFLTILCCFCLIGLLVVTYLFLEHEVKLREEFATERQILLNRIENPKYQPPLSPAEKRVDLEKLKELREETEQFGLVGKIIDK